MKISVFGTGEVGTAVASKLKSLGHDVALGSRKERHDQQIPVLNHAAAAAHGEWLVNAMHGEDALDVFPKLLLDGKLLIDIGNYRTAIHAPIEETLGESLQRLLPRTRVVKALNFVSAQLMGKPEDLAGHHSVFIAGNDGSARAEVNWLLESFGWKDIIDLGDLSACRAMEQLAPMWIRLNEKFHSVDFNLRVVRAAELD
jgi:hypothetical protein